MSFKNIGSMRKRRKQTLRKGMKVRVLGDSSVGIPGYDATIVKVFKDSVVVKDEKGNKEEIMKAEIRTMKSLQEEDKAMKEVYGEGE